ncbi:serum response factor-binding protein 1 [Lethenteron reissneri]|uniref:serum response factor-binding protein 1 n=1 Tax=Lethenteron reissneri TaxID=7753 RepID=UPI002AB7B6E8|nr:serum response factor-binding protein 1 [Lethenteron reissneri]
MAKPMIVNNEIVGMRKDVRKVKILVVRKLARSLAALRKKKGSEEDLQKNARRVKRLLEEIDAVKDLDPDTVSKTALYENITFESVCKKDISTARERALARLSTFPLIRAKIDTIKAALDSFKAARATVPDDSKASPRPGEGESEGESVGEIAGESEVESEGERDEGESAGESVGESAEEIAGESAEESSDEGGEKEERLNTGAANRARLSRVGKSEERRGTIVGTEILGRAKGAVASVAGAASGGPTGGSSAATWTAVAAATTPSGGRVGPSGEERTALAAAGDVASDEPPPPPEPEFDDSTEERFCRRQKGLGGKGAGRHGGGGDDKDDDDESEDDESDDDFFIGKVRRGGPGRRRGKRRRKESGALRGGDRSDSDSDGDGDGGDGGARRGRAQRRRPGGRAGMTTQFCSLGESRGAKGGRGKHFPSGNDRKPYPGASASAGGRRGAGRLPARGGPRGAGGAGGGSRGAPDGQRAALPTGSLHPSWEASRKRKEQLGKIPEFAGKKIKFDD